MFKSSPIYLAVISIISTQTIAQQTQQNEAVTLEPITVSAAREDSPLSKLANNITVTKEAQIQKNLNVNVADALADIPGVSFDGTGRYGLSDVTIRGVSGNRVKVLVDGQEINNQFSFGPFQNAGRQYMDLNNVKQLEVIKGPVSSLHGSDAIGGVVSLVSKTPNDYLHDEKNFGGTVFSQYTGKDKGITAGGSLAFTPNTQWDGLLSYTYDHSDETKNHGGLKVNGSARTVPDPQDNDSHSVSGQVRFKPNENHTFTLAASAYQYNRDTNVLSSLGNSVNVYNYDSYQGKDKQQRFSGSLRHDFTINQPFADSGYWNIYGQKQNSVQETFLSGQLLRANNAETQRYRKSEYEMRDIGGEVQFNKAISGAIQQNWVYGLNLSHKNVDMLRNTSDTVAGQTRIGHEKNAPNSTIQQIGVFAQNRIGFADSGFSLIPGLRYDYYRLNAKPDSTFWRTVGNNYQVRDYSEGQFSLRLGALYDFSDTQTLYANYAEGFRAPAFSETNLGFENASQGYSYVANPNLQPEKSRGLEIGWRSDNGIFKHDLSAFYTRYKNFIETQSNIGVDPNTGLTAFTSVNLPSAEIHGVELAAGVDFGGITPALEGVSSDVSLAWADGKNRKRHAPISSISPLSGHVGIAYDAPEERWGVETK